VAGEVNSIKKTEGSHRRGFFVFRNTTTNLLSAGGH
jgi:hypothetical protein